MVGCRKGVGRNEFAPKPPGVASTGGCTDPHSGGIGASGFWFLFYKMGRPMFP